MSAEFLQSLTPAAGFGGVVKGMERSVGVFAILDPASAIVRRENKASHPPQPNLLSDRHLISPLVAPV
jgi:hypothetical protein